VIWSDESSLKVGVNPRRQWVIRPKGEKLNPKYVKKTFKGERVTVMVWACFSGERLGPLIVCDEGGIGADEYQDNLYDGLFSLIDDLLEPPEDPETIQVAIEQTFLFMQAGLAFRAEHNRLGATRIGTERKKSSLGSDSPSRARLPLG